MTSGGRLGLTVRVIFLAAVLGLALAFRDPQTLQATLFLTAIAGVAIGASRATVLPERWIYLAEGVLTTLVIGVTLPGGTLLLPYLMVPPLLAGITTGPFFVVLTTGAQLVSLSLVLALGGTSATTRETLEITAPWALAGLGVGLVAHWVGKLRGGFHYQDDASYESARRLLSQLRTVARRLSSGLDPVSMADQILADVHTVLDDSRSGLFVRTEGGLLSPLGYRGMDARQSLVPEGHLIDQCWAEMAPQHGPQEAGRAAHRYRTVLPLRSGTRMIGVVISDASGPPSPKMLTELMHELDEQSLRLDTALVFDEVRSLATMEERQRLAREIHDGVAQELASLGYAVDELAATAITQSQRDQLTSLRGEISRVVTELRLSIFDLRSEISPSAGLGSALSDYVRAVGSRSGLTVHLTLDEDTTRLRNEVETELLRIAQEALTNSRKHSDAANLWVDCRVRPPYAHIVVHDDGGGLGQARPDSYGLKIMKERADRIGATLEIGEEPTRTGVLGTRVAVTVGQETSRERPKRLGSEATR